MYELPEINIKKIKKSFKAFKNRIVLGIVCLLIAGILIVAGASAYVAHYFPSQTRAFLQYFKMPATPQAQPISSAYVSNISYEQAIIDAAKNVSPSVVSIVISKNVPVYEQQLVNPFGDNSPFDFLVPQQVQNGTKYQEVGAGSGFIVSADGLVLTNKHVVSDSTADYTVYTNDGKKYSGKVLALDPVQDLAVIKIKSLDVKFQPVVLGDSSGIQLGQTAIAIGNALGQFSNTVSVGIVSGLQRTISASDSTGSVSETLENIIQTDAAINEGNSGGPLLNLKGEVIGINTATATGAQSIGFALPINIAKKDIAQVAATNKIIYPFLGVKYTLSDNGALVSAVTAGSAAQIAGIKEKDIILSINKEKITATNSMATVIQKYNPGDKITLHILRNGKEKDIDVVLGQRSS